MSRILALLARRWLAALAFAGVGLGAVGGCATFDEYQRQAIFNPARGSARWYAEPPEGTEQYDVSLPSGETLHFWYLPQAEAGSAPTVLYLHGARWNLNGSVFRLARWHDLGFNVLAVDYRGFGKSTEVLPSEASAAADTRVAFDELKRRQPEASRRYLYGHSLGGALAVELASSLPDDAIAGLIIEATFTSIPDLVKGMRWGWVPGIGLVLTQRFDSSARIGKVTAPLLILHGTGDNVVPHAMADDLYRQAGSRNKRVVKLEGVNHSGRSGSPATYRDAVRSFLQTSTAAASSSAATSSAAVAD